MTSAKDFKLISWKNGLGLSGIVVAVLIPVGIRYYFRSDIASIEDVEREEEREGQSSGTRSGGVIGQGGGGGEEEDDALEAVILQSGGPPRTLGKMKNVDPSTTGTGTLILLDDHDDDDGGERGGVEMQGGFVRTPQPMPMPPRLEAEGDELPPALPITSKDR